MGQLNSNSKHGDVPVAVGLPGMHQGALGVAQGPSGGAVGQALGGQFGIQRAQLGGMAEKTPGVANPYKDIIDSLVNAVTQGGAPLSSPNNLGKPVDNTSLISAMQALTGGGR